MTDKEKIKKDIESYKESMKGLKPHSDFRRGQLTAYNQILQFIDSLPEESGSEDLEEASRNYAEDEEYGDIVYYAIKAAFKAGSKWHKQQMMKDAVELRIVESFNPVGTENEKPHGFTALCYNAKYPDFYPVTGQTIKVVPIKEIQQNEQDCRTKGIGGISSTTRGI